MKCSLEATRFWVEFWKYKQAKRCTHIGSLQFVTANKFQSYHMSEQQETRQGSVRRSKMKGWLPRGSKLNKWNKEVGSLAALTHTEHKAREALSFTWPWLQTGYYHKTCDHENECFNYFAIVKILKTSLSHSEACKLHSAATNETILIYTFAIRFEVIHDWLRYKNWNVFWAHMNFINILAIVKRLVWNWTYSNQDNRIYQTTNCNW